MTRFKILRSWACMASLACVATAGQAAPVVVSISPGFSFQGYTGSAPLYAGRVDIDNTLFFVREASVAGMQAWTIFFDPQRNQRVAATLDFGAPILDVISAPSALGSSSLTYGVDINRDGLANDYVRMNAAGLEKNDSLSWSAGSSLMSLNWVASDPGDHVRVLVQDVPEPGTIALALLALAGLGAAQWMRRRAGAQVGNEPAMNAQANTAPA